MLPALAALGTALATILPAGAANASAAPAASATAVADVDDFSYTSWDARYEIRRDEDGRSRMQVTETLVAAFPEHDQNRGIVRGIPLSYQGAHSEPRVESVTDENGEAVPYDTEEDDGLLYILTGTDAYVHGATTYVIRYELRDVVVAAESGVDEFYWDLLPLDSTQDIGRFRAEIVFDPALSEHLTGAARCYQGPAGSTASCPMAGPVLAGDGSATFTVESGPRTAGDGVTVAIGFDAGTVVQPPARHPNPATDVAPIALGVGAIGLTAGSVVAIVGLQRSRRRAAGVVVAQYDVPDSLPPLLAEQLVGGAKHGVPAEIVHLAVRGALRIEEYDGARPGAQPLLRRLRDRAGLDPLDDRALATVFRDVPVGGTLELPKRDETFAKRMRTLRTAAKDEAAARGLTTTERSRVAMALQWVSIPVVAAGLGLSLWGLVAGRESAIPGAVVMGMGAVFAMVGALLAFGKHTVLTPEGARWNEYLLGVREFIRVAEADRIRMLQSPDGAERRPEGDVDIVLLYERLLPYAILFGQEREWGDVLETTYARHQRTPGWYASASVSGLGARVASFSSSAQSSATYSSSSGGSSGGGFSGGGGGGGFSGGR